MSGTVTSIPQRIEAFASANGMSYEAALLYLADYGLNALQNYSKAGKMRMAKVTPAERQAFARAGGLARWKHKKGDSDGDTRTV